MGARNSLIVCGAFTLLSCGGELERTTGPTSTGFALSVLVTAVPDFDQQAAAGGVVSLRLGLLDLDGVGGTVDGGVATLLGRDGAPLVRKELPAGAVIPARRRAEIRVELVVPPASAIARLELAVELTDRRQVSHQLLVQVEF
jgi:hypothetical protein